MSIPIEAMNVTLKYAYPQYRWSVERADDRDALYIRCWVRPKTIDDEFRIATKMVDGREQMAVEPLDVKAFSEWLDARAKDLIATLEGS